MGFLKKLFKSKNPNSKRFKRDMAYAVCGQHIKYVTENRDGIDEVIGKNGGLAGYAGGLERKAALLELERRGTDGHA